MRTLQEKMDRAYQAGIKCGEMGEIDYVGFGHYGQFWESLGESPFQPDARLDAAFCAGQCGTEMPRKVRGWRYGDIPASGRSYNGRDDEYEAGVSVMAVYGVGETQDHVSALFIADGRPRVEVEGWLVTHTVGGDGEPLLVGCKRI